MTGNTTRDNLEREIKGCFDFFYEQAFDSREAFGLVRDRWPSNPYISSIAGTGFGLAACCVGAEYGYISGEAARERAEKTVVTLQKTERHEGFYRHFYDIKGRPAFDSEFSTIDTAILLAGLKTAGNYFSGGIKERADEIAKAVNWRAFLGKDNFFRMAYHKSRGYFSRWDRYAEQLLLYVLAAIPGPFCTGKEPYYTFMRDEGEYRGIRYVYTFSGSLFTHQYPHAFVDFRGFRDENGTDWYTNAVNAALASRRYCMDEAHNHPTYGENCWGLTACDTPSGYVGNQGNPPCGLNGRAALSLGVVPPAGALGSLPFCPEYSLNALDYYYSLEKARGRYGLCDAVSTEQNWYAPDVVCVDKGITLIQAANYKDGLIWQLFNDNEIREAFKKLGIKKEKDEKEKPF